MQPIPVYVSAVFILTTICTVLIFYKASNYNKTVLYTSLGWLILQGVVGMSHFYTNTSALPPRFLLLVAPPLFCILVLFSTKRGNQFIDKLNLPGLTILHLVRVPVEIVLFWLFIDKAIPEHMTFEGQNFDILSGLTAPIIWYITRNHSNKSLLLTWNFICLALLVNIVVTSVLAAPTPLQKIAFDQPNIAVTYFPFVWLPGVIVPIVLLSHLAAIRQILIKRNYSAASLQ